MSPVIFPRQDPEFVEDGHRSWWYSQTASIVKWSILAGIVLFFMAWFLGGYWHARMRIRKGLPLMKYHRFLVPDHQKQKPPSALQNEFSFYRVENEGYQMDHMQPPPPPPGYDPNAPMPPSYQPPEGATKLDPNQSYDVPPPGPPPNAELPPRQPKPNNSLMSRAGRLVPKFGRK
ncbi:MAG: hypothetical protein MMC23_004714 [Stictis urceolatum]|nr:hypothetical protein [Stictis urceolata]